MPRAREPVRRRTYVALLRGINLGSRNKVSMTELRALFDALGGEDVVTYVQSGNVVFKSPGSADELTDAIEARIRRELGLQVRVLLRTKAQLGKLVAANPFAKKLREAAMLHVTFLAEAPNRARVRELEAKDFAPDEFRVVGRDVYLHCPHGYGRSKLSNAYFEKQLGVAGTTRNWRTVTKLAELVNA
jgi:uncharacterized protein (DUF1697 family)